VPAEIDRADRRLLRLLQSNGRLTNAELAKRPTSARQLATAEHGGCSRKLTCALSGHAGTRAYRARHARRGRCRPRPFDARELRRSRRPFVNCRSFSTAIWWPATLTTSSRSGCVTSPTSTVCMANSSSLFLASPDPNILRDERSHRQCSTRFLRICYTVRLGVITGSAASTPTESAGPQLPDDSRALQRTGVVYRVRP
jgi:AsnC-type helix-turn-helix domain